MTTSPALFSPLTLRDLTIRNRAWVSPMCQYSVDQRDGVPTDWHLVHLGGFATGGFGLVMTEATAVAPEGRISAEDAGIWNLTQMTAWARVVDFLHSQGAAAAIQLAHAGRKAGTRRPWPGTPEGVLPHDAGGWTPVGPTTTPFPGQDNEVHALDEAEIARVIDAFRAAARRSVQAGFDVVEIHAAHGYLLHEFYSPLSNTRTDGWGGSFEGRTRLLREVVAAVREVYDGVLFVRVSATDWTDEGWDGDDTVRLAALLRDGGVDLLDVSSGGNLTVPIPVGPGYQTPFAARVRHETGLPVSTVGLYESPAPAEDVVASGQADAVMVGRAALRNPHWPQMAAAQLGTADAAPYPPQYVRAVWRATDRAR